MGRITRGVKNTVKRNFNIREWLTTDQLTETGRSIGSSLSRYFVPKEPEFTESFEEAMRRLGVTEEQVKQNAMGFWRMALLFAVISVAIFAYVIYHIFNGHVHGAMVATALMLVCIALFFRNHFWYFQLKRRKLGCTFKEWLTQGLLGGKQ